MRLCGCLLAMVAALEASNCDRTSTGFKPLNELFFTSYKGMGGGLYPNGANQRPAAHESAGLRLASEVRPRGGDGSADEQSGKIVLLSIGLSNTTQEFSVFQGLADRDREKNPRLVIVDGAQGGWSADRIVAGADPYWSTLDQRLRAAGVTAAQVQAAWMKLADAAPTLPFPDDARRLQSELSTIVQSLRPRFPNLKLLYVSSRIYAGYASTNLNPEPFAYQSGFAVKWLIEQQIAGDAELSFEAGRAPWMAWGPYLWADGTHPRTDGLIWECSDLAQDGTHPSDSGRLKVARMLLDFFKSDSTTRPWFVAGAGAAPKPAAAGLRNAAGFTQDVAPGSIATLFGSQLAGATLAAGAMPLPPGLAGTSVLVGGETAPLYFVSPNQINLLVPPGAASGEVVVTRGTSRSEPLAARLALDTFEFFTLDGSGLGAAAALHADGRLINPQNPAARGETIQLFGTGRGVRNPAILRPELLPTVQLGGISADVQFWGPAPGFPGLDQVNITVPQAAPTGPSVPLQMQLGAFRSTAVSLAVDMRQ